MTLNLHNIISTTRHSYSYSSYNFSFRIHTKIILKYIFIWHLGQKTIISTSFLGFLQHLGLIILCLYSTDWKIPYILHTPNLMMTFGGINAMIYTYYMLHPQTQTTLCCNIMSASSLSPGDLQSSGAAQRVRVRPGEGWGRGEENAPLTEPRQLAGDRQPEAALLLPHRHRHQGPGQQRRVSHSLA